MMASKQYFILSCWPDGMMDCLSAGRQDCQSYVLITCWQDSNTSGLQDGMSATMMSCLQASQQDDMLDVMQADWRDGQHDGWHCIHCEYCLCGAEGRGL
jgi:hypothetical protein